MADNNMNDKNTQTMDPKAFRNALGQFATGVTIITTRDDNAQPVGLTANSFSSVSLDPPLVLWSLAKSANSVPVFNQAEHFAIHVLSNEQVDLSNKFASRGEDKFAGVDLDEGIAELPLLTDYAARFQCKKAYEYDGGDHIIYVGEVLDFAQTEVAPLLFHGGRYAEKRNMISASQTPDRDGSFNDDFLMYLLERTTAQATLGFHRAAEQAGISVSAMHLLAVLSLGESRSIANLKAINPLAVDDIVVELEKLKLQQQVEFTGTQDSDQVSITANGSELIMKLLVVGKSLELDALAPLDEDERWQFKSYLKRIIDATDMGIPDLFKSA